ncbi:MAG: [FeFe] hydrogenase H-cluster radical SAM maturase HydE [Caldithrix sp.]|nr:[FeFe] hydrogenase H-cluster radical SAM maturase HydE [Caldithrix sp.]
MNADIQQLHGSELREAIRYWLLQTDVRQLAALWATADQVRREHVGDAIYLRGIIEISNRCIRRCAYCGINASNHRISRYTMTMDEIVECACTIEKAGCGTVVLQSGEDWTLTPLWIADTIREIKKRTSLAVTLSLGERLPEELRQWRETGADRYLLKIETSDKVLYDRIHPPRGKEAPNRFEILNQLRRLGYETGSGIMIGIPGQTIDILTEDIITLAGLDVDMAGSGPFIAHRHTPLAGYDDAIKPDGQAGNDALTTYKVNALLRILCPQMNLPTTTALSTISARNGRALGLQRGANVIMPNFTPLPYRQCYEIYPRQTGGNNSKEDILHVIKKTVHSIGRYVASNRGDFVQYQLRRHNNPKRGEGVHDYAAV